MTLTQALKASNFSISSWLTGCLQSRQWAPLCRDSSNLWHRLRRHSFSSPFTLIITDFYIFFKTFNQVHRAKTTKCPCCGTPADSYGDVLSQKLMGTGSQLSVNLYAMRPFLRVTFDKDAGWGHAPAGTRWTR